MMLCWIVRLGWSYIDGIQHSTEPVAWATRSQRRSQWVCMCIVGGVWQVSMHTQTRDLTCVICVWGSTFYVIQGCHIWLQSGSNWKNEAPSMRAQSGLEWFSFSPTPTPYSTLKPRIEVLLPDFNSKAPNWGPTPRLPTPTPTPWLLV